MLVSFAEYAKSRKRDASQLRHKAVAGGFKTAEKIGRNWVIDLLEPLIDNRKIDQRLLYEVIEDGGGGLTLAVFDDARYCFYLHSGYEYCTGQLQQDIKALQEGENPFFWDGNSENPNEDYLATIDPDANGRDVIADNKHVYRDRMRAAGIKEFGSGE